MGAYVLEREYGYRPGPDGHVGFVYDPGDQVSQHMQERDVS